MIDTLPAHEQPVRLGSYGVAPAAQAVWEFLAPRRRRTFGRLLRRPHNLCLVPVNTTAVRMASGAHRLLPWFLVTPAMHRVHHSIVPREANANSGFNLPWRDWLFGAYRSRPAAGHDAMTVGTEAFRAPGDPRLDRMLLQPLRRKAWPHGGHPSGAGP